MSEIQRLELITHITLALILGIIPLITLTILFRDSTTRFKWWWGVLIIPGWYLAWMLLTFTLVWVIGPYGGVFAFTGAYYAILYSLSKLMHLRIPLFIYLAGFAIYMFPFGLITYNALTKLAHLIATSL